MPCPFFEPQQPAAEPRHPPARLPLIEEYAGQCHAFDQPQPAPADLRFACCNAGYSEKQCRLYPAVVSRSCTRFSVVGITAEVLDVVYIEEHDHTPVHWSRIRFLRASASLEPELTDFCARAQVLAFCQSYLRRFAA